MKREGDEAKNAVANPVPPVRDSTGLIPLTDLGTETYKGEDGGLYGGGSNEPPPGHRAAVLRELQQIRPLDAEGRPAADGKIVLHLGGDVEHHDGVPDLQEEGRCRPAQVASVVIVDTAQGARVASVWANDAEGNRGPDPWPVVDRAAEGCPRQSQAGAGGLDQACCRINPTPFPRFPACRTPSTLPTTRSSRSSGSASGSRTCGSPTSASRIYAGYATTPLNPEPYAYEGAFAARWVIQSQAAGDPLLNFDPARGTVLAPAVLWGPYLWTDGVKPRKSDNLVWLKEDVSSKDGTHPSDSGREKVANLLLDFVQKNPLASSWYLAPGRQSAN